MLLDCVCYKEDFVISNVCYIKVIFHICYCNFGQDEEYHMLYQGYIEMFIKSRFHCMHTSPEQNDSFLCTGDMLC